jgi:DTW domain-containing protein YfiP
MTQKIELHHAEEKKDLSELLAGLQSTSSEEVLFFPLYGHDVDTECYASVLRLNGQNVLLDCGWNEACDISLLAPLAVAAPFIDVVRGKPAQTLYHAIFPFLYVKVAFLLVL